MPEQAQPQPVINGTGGVAYYVVLGIAPGAAAEEGVRAFLGQAQALARSVAHRYGERRISLVVGIGSDAWNRLFPGAARPAHLHPFKALHGARHSAPSTPGDVLLHIRAEAQDVCHELLSHVMQALGDAVQPIDEVHGFRYFDARAALGFVDGTENPQGAEAEDAAFIGEEDATFAGGSYVIVQKYLHDMAAWNALSTEEQEKVIGRTKHDDIELPEGVQPSNSHVALNIIADEEGKELAIVRGNLPFARPSRGEYGTYFIAYARDPGITEQMMRNMFIGRPEGNYDRMLDYSRPVTGSLFFVPSAPMLEALAEGDLPQGGSDDDGSLHIGSLKGQ
ncbi:MAG: Dyp-type peroxidase [Ottowia sp.]|nr:Dyp-type peroxidase [Ottowia sp.]